MPYKLLTIVANGANGLKNKCCDCLANVCDAYKWACKRYKRTYEWCECLTNVAIFLLMMRIFDDKAAIGINTKWIWHWTHCFLEFNSGKKFAMNGKRGTIQTPCKCLTNVVNASECITNVTNGLRMLKKIDGEWQHLQHLLKFRGHFLNWPIFVSRWRMNANVLNLLQSLTNTLRV